MRRGFFRPVADGCLVTPTSSDVPHRHLTKISVIGAGNVGMAIAQIIFTQKLADKMALVDALPDKLRGDALYLQHAAAFLRRVRIVSGTNTAVTKNYGLVIVTAGARQIPGEREQAQPAAEESCPLSQDRAVCGRALPGGAAARSLQPRRRAHLRRLEALLPPGQPRHRLLHQPRPLPLQVPHRQAPRRQRAGRAALVPSSSPILSCTFSKDKATGKSGATYPCSS